MVVDVVGGHDLGGAAVGEGDEGVVAGRVERVAVVPQLHHHVGPAEQGLEPAQLGGSPGRPLGDQGGRDHPLAAPGQHHPVIGWGRRERDSPLAVPSPTAARSGSAPAPMAARVSRSTDGRPFSPPDRCATDRARHSRV